MFQLGKTIISEQILDADFACNLSACKGACCVDGDAGAPLEHNETEKLKAIYPKIKSYLRPQGIEAIERQGTFVTNEEGEFETPLVDGADCAYVILTKSKRLCVALKKLITKEILIGKNKFLAICTPYA